MEPRQPDVEGLPQRHLAYQRAGQGDCRAHCGRPHGREFVRMARSLWSRRSPTANRRRWSSAWGLVRDGHRTEQLLGCARRTDRTCGKRLQRTRPRSPMRSERPEHVHRSPYLSYRMTRCDPGMDGAEAARNTWCDSSLLGRTGLDEEVGPSPFVRNCARRQSNGLSCRNRSSEPEHGACANRAPLPDAPELESVTATSAGVGRPGGWSSGPRRGEWATALTVPRKTRRFEVAKKRVMVGRGQRSMRATP